MPESPKTPNLNKLLEVMRKVKINMNTDRNAKDIVSDLKQRLGENQLSQS